MRNDCLVGQVSGSSLDQGQSKIADVRQKMIDQ
jgi:hypothetical protein